MSGGRSRRVLVERALGDAFGALEVDTTESVAGARNLEHRGDGVADVDGEHRGAADSAGTLGKAKGQSVLFGSIRRPHDGSAEERSADQQIVVGEDVVEARFGDRAEHGARGERARGA